MKGILWTAAALVLSAAPLAAQEGEPENSPQAEAAMAEFDQLLAELGRDAARVGQETDALVAAAAEAEQPPPGAASGGAGPDSGASGTTDAGAGGADQPPAAVVIESAEVSDSEPNESFGSAQAAAPRGSIRGTVQPRGDVDWYRLTVPKQGALRLASTTVPQNLDISLRIWTADKGVLTDWYGPLAVGGEVVAVADLPAPGTYFVELRDGRDDNASTDTYAFDLSFTPTADSGEPNDSFGTATPVKAGESLHANILPRGDVDWYELVVADQGEMAVTIDEVPEGLDMVFRVWTAEKSVLSDWQSPLRVGGSTEATVDLPRAGRYLLEVRDGRDDARSEQPYRLQVSFTPSGDSREPNDSFGAAAALALGEEIEATILPRGDVDWYRAEIPAAGELLVEIGTVPANLDVHYRVWNADKGVVSDWQAPLRAGGPVSGRTGLAAPGIYFLEVRDGRDDARSVEPYRLRATAAGG